MSGPMSTLLSTTPTSSRRSRFTGKLEKLTIKVEPEQLTPEDRELLGRTSRDFD
jgi:hypothetical protein